ncbi:MAG: hypothetical protein COA94_00295 [Rickettsiales bacterium]|nr:MAG: hypothetical protein COA94_00295 [Rickettsiales bacterium]
MSFSKFHIELDNDLAWKLVLLFSAMLLILGTAESAFATENKDVIGETLCRLADTLRGSVAKAVATMAIFSVGVGLFLGKLNWGVAAATAVGIAIMFSAPRLISFISGVDYGTKCLVD